MYRNVNIGDKLVSIKMPQTGIWDTKFKLDEVYVVSGITIKYQKVTMVSVEGLLCDYNLDCFEDFSKHRNDIIGEILK